MSENYYDVCISLTDHNNMRLELSEAQLLELTNAALYGVGWFRHNDGTITWLLNLSNVVSVMVTPYDQ